MAANSNIMVIGAAGQIGTDLTPALRKRHDREAVIAVCRQTKPAAEVLDGGPCEFIDATDKKQLGALIDRYRVGTIYHLAAIMMLFEATFDAYLEPLLSG